MNDFHIQPADLLTSLLSAQQALQQLEQGSTGNWLLPAGTFELPAGLQLGAAGRTLRLIGNRTTLVFSPPASDQDSTALKLSGEQVVVEDISLRARGNDELIGLQVRAEKTIRLQGLQLRELRGGQVTGIDVAAPQVDLGRLVLAGLGADTVMTGIHARAGTRLTATRIRMEELRGHRIRALVLHARSGTVNGLLVRGLHAGNQHPLPLVLGETTHLEINGFNMERELSGPDLHQDLIAAQAGLADAPDGSAETWHLPAGTFELPSGAELGKNGVSLTLCSGEEPCCLHFPDIADSTAALTLRGRCVTMTGLEISARSSGAITAVRIHAGKQVEVRNLRLAGIRGTGVTGLAVDSAGATVRISDLVIERARAGSGDCLGLQVRARTICLQRIRATILHAFQAAVGISVQAATELTATGLHISAIIGTRAHGAALIVQETQATLQLLDATLRRIETPADGVHAVGLLVFSGGQCELRGLTVGEIKGCRTAGLLAAAGGRFDCLAGAIDNIRGLAGGAAGMRVMATESGHPVQVADMRIEAVYGTTTGSSAQPCPSWLHWWQQVLQGTEHPLSWPEDNDFAEEVTGLHLACFVAEKAAWLADDPGPVRVQDCMIRRISGTALQVDGGLRDIDLRRTEAWTSLRGGWVDGERVRMLQVTWHRHLTGLAFGPCMLVAGNSLLTGIVEGAGIILDSGTTPTATAGVHVSHADEPFAPEPDPLPYLQAGPATIPPSMRNGALAPAVQVDLRLKKEHDLVAAPVPGEPAAAVLFVGAHEPKQPHRCELRDPLPPKPPPPQAGPDRSPVVDYMARDARSLLALMMDRASVVLPDWQERNPADQTTMFMELLASELDRLSYRQEVAVSEGYLSTALQRRSIEDHARLVDYIADSGLSATTLVAFDINDQGMAALGLAREETLLIPADTMLVNPDARDEVSTIFATEAALRYDPRLRAGELRLAEPIRQGMVHAVLQGDLLERGVGNREDRLRIAAGRWLAFVADDPEVPPLCVCAVRVETGTDTTCIFWDPRRVAAIDYRPDSTRIHANIVPAHHGVLLAPLSEYMQPGALTAAVDLLAPWREQMTMVVDNRNRDRREIELPLAPVSVQAPGWPLPGEDRRSGAPKIEVWINGEAWHHVEHLSLARDGEECFAVRSGRNGGTALRFGDGRNGAALPAGRVTITLRMRVGLGRAGNVGPDALTRILCFGNGGELDKILPGAEDRDLLIATHLQTTNIVAAVGGRDPEPLEKIRYRAPRSVRDSLAAVALEDYRRLLERLPEVASARAVLVDAGVRRIVRVTVLLQDEDTLLQPELGPYSEAERMRRWGVVRSFLESIRLLGFDVEIVPPKFVPLDLDLTIDVGNRVAAEPVRQRVVQALAGDGGLFDPDVSGLGRAVHTDQIHRTILQVDGVEAVSLRRLRRLEPGAAEYARQECLPMAPDEVAILHHPYGDGPDGLVTVKVCGGMA